MREFKIYYTGNTYDELSKIIKKLKWNVFNLDGSELLGSITDGEYFSTEINNISINNSGIKTQIEIKSKYRFLVQKKDDSNLLLFSYYLTEIKTNPINDDLISNNDIIELKNIIDVNLYSKKETIIPEIFRRNIAKYRTGRNPSINKDIEFENKFESDSSYEFMILMNLMKKMDKRLDYIESLIKSDTTFRTKDVIINNDDKVLSVMEVSKLLGLAKATIYSKVSRRELPHMKRGKILYFSEKEINEYIKGGKVLSNTEIDEISRNYIGNLKPNK